DDALDEQLPDDASAGGAERRADGELAAPAYAAREQQVRDVGARDEQHGADGAEQYREREPVLPDDPLLQRQHANQARRVRLGEFAREPFADRAELGAGLFGRRAGREPRDRVDEMRASLGSELRANLRDRD